MAAPFYNQGDQDIYAGGEHFIPQERFRLGYTPSQSLASTIGNTGITNTQAANPYIYPQGGGGGGGGGFGGLDNKYGLDLSTQKTVTVGMANAEGVYEPTPIKIAKSAGGIWKNKETGQNVYHGNYDAEGVIGTVMNKMFGKKNIPGVPDEGSTTGAEWQKDFDESVARKKLTTYQRWKAKKEFKKEQEKIAAEISGGATVSDDQKGGFTHSGDIATGSGQGDYQAPNIRSEADEGIDTKGSGMHGGKHYAQGGRIGYAYGTPDPEEPAENIFEVMQDQNIPFSEQVEGGPTEEQIAMVMDMDSRKMGIDEIVSLTGLGKEIVLNILGVEMAQGGIARLL